MPDPTPEVQKLEFTPAVFDPNEAQLREIVAEVAQITADPSKMTKEDFDLINTTKNKLVKFRTAIQKRGKEARAEAIKFQKDVIAYEDSLIAIIEPEEKRLKEIEAAAKEYAIREERKKTLPEFKAKLESIGDTVLEQFEPDYDSFLLSLDPNGRDEYYNERLGKKLEADRAADEERRRKEDEERQKREEDLKRESERIENEKKLAEEREWGARTSRILGMGFRDAGNRFELGSAIVISKDEVRMLQTGAFEAMIADLVPKVETEKKRLEDEAEAKRQDDIRKAQEQAKEEERSRLQREEEQRKEEVARKEAEEKAEAEKRSRAEAYQKFLNENSYNADTDITTFENGVTTLYRKVATYNHPQ